VHHGAQNQSTASVPARAAPSNAAPSVRVVEEANAAANSAPRSAGSADSAPDPDVSLVASPPGPQAASNKAPTGTKAVLRNADLRQVSMTQKPGCAAGHSLGWLSSCRVSGQYLWPSIRGKSTGANRVI